MEDLDGKILVVPIVAAGACRLTVEQVGGGEGIGGGWCGPTESRQGGVSAAVVVCAGLMSHGRHILESSPPQDPRRPEAASEFAARPWLGFFTPQAHITAMARGREHVPRVARGP